MELGSVVRCLLRRSSGQLTELFARPPSVIILMSYSSNDGLAADLLSLQQLKSVLTKLLLLKQVFLMFLLAEFLGRLHHAPWLLRFLSST